MVPNGARSDRTFNIVNISIMIILIILTVYPFYFSIINSLNDGTDLRRGPSLWPRVFRFDSWAKVLSDATLLKAGMITLSRTIIVIVIQILNTAMFTYAFSRPYLKFKKFYVAVGFVSMYFPGALIPTFILYNWLGIYDNLLGLYSTYSCRELSRTSSYLMPIIRPYPMRSLNRRKWTEPMNLKFSSPLLCLFQNRLLQQYRFSWQYGYGTTHGTTLFFTQNTQLANPSILHIEINYVKCRC